jgi:ribonuclease VapC
MIVVLDASAALAILFEEPDALEVEATLAKYAAAVMSPVNYWEVLVRARAVDGQRGYDAAAFIARLAVEIAPIDPAAARAAADAFARFGTRTPAALNLGDCFAYALAKQRNAPLLFKGADFANTDVAAA